MQDSEYFDTLNMMVIEQEKIIGEFRDQFEAIFIDVAVCVKILTSLEKKADN